MTSDAITAGVKPGGLQSRTEIRVLICYLLCNVKEPLDLETVKERLHFEGIANYFETAFAIGELADGNNIAEVTDNNGNKLYTASEECRSIAEALGSSVPFSVRERALEIAEKSIERRRYERENDVKIEQCDNGFYVTCTVLDNGMELCKVKLLVPDSDSANAVKENFYQNPTEVLIKATECLINTQL